MKKVFLMIAMVMFVFMGYSQTSKNYHKFWGETANITAKSTATTFTVPIGFDNLPVYQIQIFTDSISGTPGYTAKVEQSLDGTNWFAITGVANVTTTLGPDTSFLWTDTAGFYSRWLKVTLTTNGTTQSLKPYGYIQFRDK